jgi:hypothetical protein
MGGQQNQVSYKIARKNYRTNNTDKRSTATYVYFVTRVHHFFWRPQCKHSNTIAWGVKHMRVKSLQIKSASTSLK